MKRQRVEQWRPIPGYEGEYDVSNLGKIRSLPRNGTKPEITIRATPIGQSTGYPMVILRSKGKAKGFNVHQLVMLAFVGPCPAGMEVCHENNDRTNPCLYNLRYDTRKNNHKDKERHGTWQGGEANGAAKLSWADIPVIKSRAMHESYRDIAKDYNMTGEAIGMIVRGQTWAKKPA